jgi:hypothetical protein
MLYTFWVSGLLEPILKRGEKGAKTLDSSKWHIVGCCWPARPHIDTCFLRSETARATVDTTTRFMSCCKGSSSRAVLCVRERGGQLFHTGLRVRMWHPVWCKNDRSSRCVYAGGRRTAAQVQVIVWASCTGGVIDQMSVLHVRMTKQYVRRPFGQILRR